MIKQIYVSKVTEFVHRFTNYKFEIFIYEDKLLWNWFEWSSSYDIYIKKAKIQIPKPKFEKFEPKELIYRNFKQVDSSQFKLENSSSPWKKIIYILDKHAPKKTPNFNKILCKQMMTRSCLKNKANKSKTPSDIVKFKRQRSLVSNLGK